MPAIKRPSIIESYEFALTRTTANAGFVLPIWITLALLAYIRARFVPWAGGIYVLGCIQNLVSLLAAFAICSNGLPKLSRLLPTLRTAMLYVVTYMVFLLPELIIIYYRLLRKLPHAPQWLPTWLLIPILSVFLYYYSLRLFFMAFPILDRGAGLVDAIRESYRITKGFCIKLILQLLPLLIAMPFSFALGKAASSACASFIASYLAVAQVFLYRQLLSEPARVPVVR